LFKQKHTKFSAKQSKSKATCPKMLIPNRGWLGYVLNLSQSKGGKKTYCKNYH